MPITGTAIVALRKEAEIVLGVDSQSLKATANGLIVLPAKCKIRQAKNVFFAASGLSESAKTNYSADENAKNAIEQTDSIANAIKKFDKLIRPKLRAAIENTKLHRPNQYHGMLKDAAVCSVVMVGFEDGAPVVGAQIIKTKTLSTDAFRLHGRPRSFDHTVAQQRFGTVLGATDAILAYMIANPGFWHGDPIGAVSMLLKLQAEATPEKVAPPFAIIRLTADGVEWIEKGACSQ